MNSSTRCAHRQGRSARLAQKRSDYDTARTRMDAAAQALETARGKLREQPVGRTPQTGHAQEAAVQRCTQLAALEEQQSSAPSWRRRLTPPDGIPEGGRDRADGAGALQRANRAYLGTGGHPRAHARVRSARPVCGATEHPCPAAAPEQTPDAAGLPLADSDRRAAVEHSAQAAGRGQLEVVREAIAQAPGTDAAARRTRWQIPSPPARGGRARRQRSQQAHAAAGAHGAADAGSRSAGTGDGRQQQTGCRIAQEIPRSRRGAELDADVLRRAQELPHENRAAAQRALDETRAQCDALQQALDTARTRSNAAQSAFAGLAGKRDALRAQLQTAPPADITALRARRDDLTVRAEQLQKQISTCAAQLEQNRAARTAIDTQRQQHTEVRARWQWVHTLAATANGAVPGKEKIMLETYIQTAYFDRILGRANTRLLIMSGGQYELRRCARAGDNRSQTGLELEVIDHYNGTARSVKTLSGGETFAASLSLALGLSDEVQATAGGVQLEAMFVDEGFGSLDSEALQQALAALVGVSGGNRIVGIISHVAELKDRIDRQIIVTKDRSGGSRVQVQA
ncbi:MAG: SbcC/MukB-like Walker B domain-containing protein [Oscillospiraceae bacterium]